MKMNKQELLNLFECEYKRTKNAYWLSVIGKLKKVDGQNLLNAINRHITAVSALGIAPDVVCINEIIEDAKLNQFIYKVVDNDLVHIIGSNKGLRGGSYRVKLQG